MFLATLVLVLLHLVFVLVLVLLALLVLLCKMRPIPISLIEAFFDLSLSEQIKCFIYCTNLGILLR